MRIRDAAFYVEERGAVCCSGAIRSGAIFCSGAVIGEMFGKEDDAQLVRADEELA